MKKICVLGSGCSKCKKVAEKLQDHIDKNNIDATVEKNTDPQALITYSVMKTPAIVIDDELVHGGSIPTDADIENWLAS